MTIETDAGALLSTRKTVIVSTATFLMFEPGLYAIVFKADSSGSTNIGVRLPCARLEATAGAEAGRISVMTLPEGGWISTETASAYVLVAGGRAGALLTIYRSSDMATAPTVQFRAVFKRSDMQSVAPAATELPALTPVPAAETCLLRTTVHFQSRGDVVADSGSWIGQLGDLLPIEGFQLEAAGLNPGDITYQGVMGQDWVTPWFEAGEYCGSRGLNLPILGYQIRLSEEASQRFTVEYYGIFDGAITIGPLMDGVCSADGKSLTALCVSLRQKDRPVDLKKSARPRKPGLLGKTLRR